MNSRPDDSAPLAGRVALVTGASSGLGRAAAIRLARAGADVGLLARSAEDLGAVADAVRAEGRQAVALACDLADAAGIEKAVRRTAEELGPSASWSTPPAPMSPVRSRSSPWRTGSACRP